MVEGRSGIHGGWKVVTVVNWSNRQENLELDLDEIGCVEGDMYHVFDFWAQEYLGILEGNEHLEANLRNGEARVYSLRAVENHPQIVGTNRHVMCGMMELQNVEWNASDKSLAFDVDVVGGETMVITIALPDGAASSPESASADGLEVSLDSSDGVALLSAKTDENRSARITVSFR